MKQLVEAILENLSTKEVFLFRIACAGCGVEYANKPTRFSKAGVTPASQSKKTIYEALYEQEFRAARHAAVRVGAEHMNYCPICKRLVCDLCFLICDDLDMCRPCAVRLHETGESVLDSLSESVDCVS